MSVGAKHFLMQFNQKMLRPYNSQMPKRHPVPRALPIAAIILIALGAFAIPLIQSATTPQQRADNVLLSAAPFLLIFVAIILLFITLIWWIATRLNHNVPEKTYRPIEYTLIGGIVFGIVGMFQPWVFVWYQWGFVILLLSTLSFILWSHIVPKREKRTTARG